MIGFFKKIAGCTNGLSNAEGEGTGKGVQVVGLGVRPVRYYDG